MVLEEIDELVFDVLGSAFNLAAGDGLVGAYHVGQFVCQIILVAGARAAVLADTGTYSRRRDRQSLQNEPFRSCVVLVETHHLEGVVVQQLQDLKGASRIDAVGLGLNILVVLVLAFLIVSFESKAFLSNHGLDVTTTTVVRTFGAFQVVVIGRRRWLADESWFAQSPQLLKSDLGISGGYGGLSLHVVESLDLAAVVADGLQDLLDLVEEPMVVDWLGEFDDTKVAGTLGHVLLTC